MCVCVSFFFLDSYVMDLVEKCVCKIIHKNFSRTVLFIILYFPNSIKSQLLKIIWTSQIKCIDEHMLNFPGAGENALRLVGELSMRRHSSVAKKWATLITLQ